MPGRSYARFEQLSSEKELTRDLYISAMPCENGKHYSVEIAMPSTLRCRFFVLSQQEAEQERKLRPKFDDSAAWTVL